MKKTIKLIIGAAAIVAVATIVVLVVLFMNEKKQTEFYKSQPLNLPENFTYTAHTGCCGTSDNSLESIKVGVEHSASIVEFDLYFDSENIPVLSHDKPVGGEVTLDEAFKLVSTYEALMVNVDVKDFKELSVVWELAKKYNIEKRIFFTGVESENVEIVKTECPDVPYYLNVDVKKAGSHTPEYLNELIKTIKDNGAVGINFNKDSASKELVDAFHKNDLLVSIWTVSEEKDMYKILYFAPDNITTRNPDVLKELLQK